MKKVLVTGSTGFVGSYVVEELLNRNFQVIASSSNKEKAAKKSWFNKVEYVEMDLKTFDSSLNYFELLGSPDLLIHLAWEGLPNYLNDFHVNENLPRHKDFILNMLQNGLKDLTVSGTCFEYGMVNGILSESIEVNPDNPYAIAKNLFRKYIESLSLNFSFDFKWVRLFYMYGDGQNPKSLISQLDKALLENQETFNMSGGMQVRDFLHISTVAEYIVSIASQNEIKGIVNCCSGMPVTVKDFVLKYLESKNKKIQLNLGYYPYATYEPMEFWGDITKLKSIINNE
jgi:dTDP-6-deoxy-L-talose 4-dehydrogenase (NAD+)